MSAQTPTTTEPLVHIANFRMDFGRTTVIRDAATVADGDRVRVTLARGELDCHVIDRSHD